MNKRQKAKRLQAIRRSKKTDKERKLELSVLGATAGTFYAGVDESTKAGKTLKKRKAVPARQPAWTDADDDNNEHRRRDVNAGGSCAWAKLSWQRDDDKPTTKDDDDTDDDNDEASRLMTYTGDYLGESRSLPQNILSIKPCTNLNHDEPSSARLTSVQFHPRAQVALTAGFDQKLSLFQVDGKSNKKVQSIFMQTFPIYKAKFSRFGEEVIMTSRLRSFYYYDMIGGSIVNVPKIKGLDEKQLTEFEVSPDGKFLVFLGQQGAMHLLSAVNKEHIGTLRMNGSVESVTFSADGTRMYSFGTDSHVYVWDMDTRMCVHRFTDDGGFNGSAVAVSPDNRYLATGSQSGVINIYDVNTANTSAAPKPLKTVMNLTTPCDVLKFNPTNEILCASSKTVDSALKLVHLPAFSVFQNFPELNSTLKIPQCVDFSLHSGYFTVANQKGQALLYRLRHYKQY